MLHTARTSMAAWALWQVLLLTARPVVAQDAPFRDKAASPEADAAALVEQALRRELAGDAAGRKSLLEKALRLAPEFAPARWHAGQVLSRGKWQPVEQVQRQAAANPAYAKYRTLRQGRSGNLAGEINLARWCHKHGLDDEAALHWRFVLGLQPKNQEAMDALGVVLHEGRHLTPDERDAEEVFAAQRAEVHKRWSAQADAWRQTLAGDDSAAAQAALKEIAAVNDPQAIASIQHKISEQSVDAGLAVISMLSTMRHPAATGALASHAVRSSNPEVRAAAARALQGRSLNGIVPPLLDALAMPLESWFTVMTDGRGGVFYRHEVYREGLAVDVAHSITNRLDQDFAIPRNAPFVRSEAPARAARAIATKADQAVSAFANRARGVEQQVTLTNRVVQERNRRIAEVLRTITEQNFDDNPRTWWNWWADQNELYLPQDRPVEERRQQKGYYVRWEPRSCFAQGTPVWTPRGQTPIETLQFGDLVLSQNVETGELTWKPVLQVTVRPPSPMRELRFGGEAIFATRGHPFWVNGNGWRMAKQLQPGELLHSVHGPLTVEDNAERVELPAYNLVVGDFATYFVGRSGVLVHDNTLALPTAALTPGLHEAGARD